MATPDSNLRHCTINRGEHAYDGSRAALEQSGLIPEGTPFPGEQPGKHGVRWRDDKGRRHVLSKCGFGKDKVPNYRLTIYPTPEERRVESLRAERSRKAIEVKKSLDELNMSEGKFRGIRKLVLMAATTELIHDRGEAWVFDDDTRDEIREHLAAIAELISSGTVVPRRAQVDRLKAELDRLSDPAFQAMLEQIVEG